MIRSCFVLLIVSIFYSCKPKIGSIRLKEGKIKGTAEYVGFTDTTFSNQAFKFVTTHIKWFKGPLSIEEKITSITETVKGKTTERQVITGYVFADFKSKKAAEYLTLSDTALPIQTFNLYDTVKLNGGNMHWGGRLDTTTLSPKVDVLTDTIINDIKYKRAVRYYTQNIPNKPKQFVQIYYLRPDLSQDLANLFFWSDSLSKTIKAPYVWAEERMTIGSPLILTKFKLDFESDTLTARERKIFETWGRNMNK